MLPDEFSIIVDNGVPKFLIIDDNGTPKFAIGEKGCECCDDRVCCMELQGGVFSTDGTKLIYENDVRYVEFTVPRPNDRVICRGERLTNGLYRLKDPYRQSSEFDTIYTIWLDPDWRTISHGTAEGGDLECGPETIYYVFKNRENEFTFELLFHPCYVDRKPLQLGEIFLAADVNQYPDESLSIQGVYLDVPSGTDCCPWPEVCLECQWVWQQNGLPVVAEMVNNERTYWFENQEWGMLLVGVPNDPTTNRIKRGETANWRFGIRPPKETYRDGNYGSSSDVCVEHVNWVDAGGTQDHPQQNPLDDLEPSLTCFPDDFELDNTNCPDIHRTRYQTPAKRWTATMTIPECIDDCGNGLMPSPPAFNIRIGAAAPFVDIGITPEFYFCPPPSGVDCCNVVCNTYLAVAHTIIGNNPLAPWNGVDPAANVDGLQLLAVSSIQRENDDGSIDPNVYELIYVWAVCCRYLVGTPEPRECDDLLILDDIEQAFLNQDATVDIVDAGLSAANEEAALHLAAGVEPGQVFNSIANAQPPNPPFDPNWDVRDEAGFFTHQEYGILPIDCCATGEET